MIRCDICEAEVGDEVSFCSEGHAVGDDSTGVVSPAGSSGDGAVVRPSGDQQIGLVTLERTSADALLSEAFGVLAENFRSEPAGPDTPSGSTRPGGPPTAEAVATEEPPSAEAVAMEEQPQDDGRMPAPFEPETAPVIEPVAAGVHEPGVGDAADVAPSAAPPGADREGLVPIGSAELFGKPSTAHRGSRRRLLVVPLILAVLGGAGAFVLLGGQRADAATYRRLFTPKETHRYSFEMTMDGTLDAGPIIQPMRMRIGMTMTERTVSVDAGGVATISQAIDSVDMTMNDERLPMPDISGVTITVRMAPDGRVLSVDGLGGLGVGEAGPATELLGPNSFTPLLPSNAVAPGDEWTVVEEMPTPFGQALKMTARNRLVQLGSEGGVETALIRSNLDMPMNLRIGMDELLAMAEESGVPVPDAGFPRGAEFVYDGGMQFDLLQTVVVATGRPLTVSGSGTGDIAMSLGGVPGLPEMRMRFSVTATLAEIRDAA